MSTFSQFFPIGGGGDGDSTAKMDVDVFILSGGGGAAISGGTSPPQAQSGHGGGGAVFQGTIPIKPGSTVPIVVGGGGAGHSGQPSPTNQHGAIGGCSKITYPEGTLCVAGGGGGAPTCLYIGSIRTVYCSLEPTSPYVACRGTHTAGTGGSGGDCRIPGNDTNCECGLHDGPGGVGPSQDYVNQGGRSIYGTGQYIFEALAMCQTDNRIVKARQWCGTSTMNHKYGQFSGGTATGGVKVCSQTNGECYFNSFASGGAGSSAIIHYSEDSGIESSSFVAAAGKGVCSDITGTLLEYGMGASAVDTAIWPSVGAGKTNFGGGGRAQKRPDGCADSANGGSGTVVVRYPTQFAAAPSFPGANDCSPATPGYYTYKFDSTGSITLP